ncbi:MAG: MotA/TolQ/ExbB proton channel family protein [bacterium]
MQCSVCGLENPAGQKTCSRCSNVLSGQAEPAAVPGAPAANADTPAPKAAAAPAPAPPAGTPAAAAPQPPAGTPAGIPPAAQISKYSFPDQSGTAEIFVGREGTSDTSLLTAGLIGLVITALWYVAVLPLFEGTYFNELFVLRGAIPYPLTYFFFWVMTMVFFKVGKMVSQKKAFKMKLLPDDAEMITPESVNQILDSISKQVKRSPKEKILVNRIWIALQNFQHTNSLESTTDLLSYQADIDIGILETTYVMINLFIWALPIWGFLGTVVGIGGAISGFTKVIQSSVEMSAIKDALSVVTGGLSTAFDTTLLGLVCAMIVMFISTPLKKMEEELLSKVEEYILNNLIHKLQAAKVDLEVKVKPEEMEEHLITDVEQAKNFKDIIQQAFKSNVELLTGAFKSMQEGVSSVMQEISDQTSGITEKMSGIPETVKAFEGSINAFGDKIAEVASQQSELVSGMNENLNNLSPLMDAVTKISKNLAEEREIFNKNVDSWMKNLEKMGSGFTEEMSEERKQLSQSLEDWALKWNEVTNQLGETSDKTLGQLSEMGGVFQGISEKQDEIINGLGYNVEQLSNTDTQFQSALEAISTLLSNQEEMIGGVNQILEQQTTSDSGFKETLGGINQSLGSLVAPLENLAKPRKVRLVEE